MAINECKDSAETPLQAELRHLKYQVLNELQCIEQARERLLIARTKLAAVKKLVK